MPALMLLVVISSGFGFSRNRRMLPSPVGLDQAVGAGVVDRRQHDRRPRLRSRCSPITAGRSISVSTSPLKTTTESVTPWAAYLIAPPVPSGAGSTT